MLSSRDERDSQPSDFHPRARKRKVSLLDPRGNVIDTMNSDLPADVDALCYEACEAARVISAGGTSSPLMPARESLEISQTLDEILRQVNASWTDAATAPSDREAR